MRKRRIQASAEPVDKKPKFEPPPLSVPDADDLVVVDEVGGSDEEDEVVLSDSDDDCQILPGPSGPKLVNRKRTKPEPVDTDDSDCDVRQAKQGQPVAGRAEGLNHSGAHDPRSVPPLANPRIFDLIHGYRKRFPRAFNYFDEQIVRHFMENAQSDTTYWWKMEVWRNLRQVIRRAFPAAELYVVGSTMNGCGAFSSDMDLCCHIHRHPSHHLEERSFAMQCLRKIQKCLFQNRHDVRLSNCCFIRAKVPILRVTFHDPYDGLEVDLNVNNVAGISNSHLMHYYSRVDDRFPELCLLVKHWAKRNGIGEAMTGTLNSYSLILLTIHFLQVAVQPPILPNLQSTHRHKFDPQVPLLQMTMFEELEVNYPDPKQNTCTPGELLIAFFDYYAHFDFENWAISIKRAEVFPRQLLPADTFHYKMYIEEPFDELNTARCVVRDENFDKIMDAFRAARAVFLGDRRPSLSNLGVQKLFGADH